MRPLFACTALLALAFGLAAVFQALGAAFTVPRSAQAATATLDFPSTGVGAVADLPVAWVGAADGDTVTVAPPVAACTTLLGSYSAFASNAVVYVRFTPTAALQDPASGSFRITVARLP